MINMLVNSTNNATYGSTSSLQKSNQYPSYNKKLGSLKTSISPRRPYMNSLDSDRNPASDSSRSSIGNLRTSDQFTRPSRLSRLETNTYQPSVARSRLQNNENSSSFDVNIGLQKRLHQQELMRHEKEREQQRERDRDLERRQHSRERELRELDNLRDKELKDRDKIERNLRELELRERTEQRMRDRDRDLFAAQYHDTMPPLPPGHSRVNKNYLQKMKKKFKNKISANLSGTKFEIVREAVEALGCKILADDNFNCNLIWDDTRVSVEGISELKSFQRYNHFPAMSEISRKDALARNMLKMYKIMPQEFDFVPKTWVMPTEFSSFVSHAVEGKKTQQKKTYIMKPSNGAMGHGIRLFRNYEKIQPNDNYIIQEYISNPYLWDGFKFDLRIYALVTSCDPLRAFIYNNGLVRLGTEQYQEPNESNIDRLFMHLTNYSVNKRNKQHYDEGDSNGETGTKRSLRGLFEHLRRNDVDVPKLWKSIQDIILKTLIVAEPYLFHTYKMCRPGQLPGGESVCFEILGFDILLDDKLKPWVLEVNRCPSFGASQQIDFDIKSRLLIESFDLLHLRATDRQRSQLIEKAEAQRRLYNMSTYSTKADPAASSEQKNSLAQQPNSSLPKKFKSKEKRKLELIDQIKLLRREQKRQEYENRNMGNFSRLFPIEDKYDMDFYLNILSSAFNLFYPIGKHVQWKKTYERIKEDQLLNELAEVDEDLTKHNDPHEYERQAKKINEYLKDDYMNSETEEDSHSDSDHEPHHGRHHDDRRHHYDRDRDEDRRFEERYKSYRDSHDARNSLSHMSDRDELRDMIRDELEQDERRRHHHHHHHHGDGPDELTKDQAKRVSLNTIVNQEHIKANRVNTLINAVTSSATSSTTNLAKIGKNKPARSTSTNDAKITLGELKTPLANKQKRNSTTQTSAGVDSKEPAVQSLLKQINQHQNKLHDINPKPSTSMESNSIATMASSAPVNGNEEIANNNMATLTVAVLKMLNELNMKFPGKNNEQTKNMLNKFYSKFDNSKQKLASYWMVKLDDAKRTKIINIVKSNIIVILQKVFSLETIDNLRLYKVFVKLLNRMLWSHGQGLWNCFVNDNNASWEVIFNKSTFSITDNEMKCCCRIVELCKDCVVIVYQYAFEQKPQTHTASADTTASSSTYLSSAVSTSTSTSTATTATLKSKFK